jgi:hypothetical protein
MIATGSFLALQKEAKGQPFQRSKRPQFLRLSRVFYPGHDGPDDKVNLSSTAMPPYTDT